MTPAIELLKKSQVPHEVLSYHHDPKAASYGLEAAEKLGLAPETVFKPMAAPEKPADESPPKKDAKADEAPAKKEAKKDAEKGVEKK